MQLTRVYFSSHLNKAYPHFVNPSVHNLLYGTVFLDPHKIHNPELRNDKSVKIKLLSQRELESIFTRQKIQIPVILPMRSTETKIKVYEENFKLQGLIPANQRIVFIDISLEASFKNRTIVARNPDGSLTDVSSSDRDRLNQIYFPLPHRKIRIPNMFNDKFLDEILVPDNFQYILDRACVQFEPNDENYHKVFDKILERISNNSWKADMGLEQLKYSRYFGIVVLHFVIKNDLLPLIHFYLSQENFTGLVVLIKIFTIIHPNSSFSVKNKSANIFKPLDDFDFEYLSIDTDKSINLLKSFLELESHDIQGKKNVYDILQKLSKIPEKKLTAQS